MKKTLPILIALLTGLNFSQAQVTQLSNNTNLYVGLPISATKAIFLQQDTDSLWVTDGTPANTRKLNVPVKLEAETSIALWNDKLYFSGVNDANGAELWVTDGTDGGTSRVKDINAGAPSSSPTSMVVFNNVLYFFASTPDMGAELWKSNGTEAGTEMVKDINDGAQGSYNTDISYYLFNNELYFSAVQASNGLELWKTNGTTNGTVLIKDINPASGSSAPEFLQVFNNELFFTANDGTLGRELFKTNGTLAGTGIVKDIFPGNQGSGIESVLEFAGKMLFNARNAAGNEELYASDGTTGGTNLLKEINSNALLGSDPDVAGGIIINNKLIFAATAAATGRELYVTDGTGAGTVLFRDVIPGLTGSDPRILLDYNLFANLSNPGISMVNHALYNGKIFFTTSVQGIPSGQLWITDGTALNTLPVKDFGPGGLLGFITTYFYTQSGLYFDARNSADPLSTDFEIFKSQGTGPTTSLYADVWPGEGGSNPVFQFFVLNGKVFFVANDGDSEANLDLYVLSSTEQPLPLQLLKFAAAAVTDGVNLDWTTSNERESKEFELQRSIEGSSFQPIGLVKAGGQGTNKKDYDYFDKDAYKQKSTTLYYRLKIIDNDGKFTYSPIAFIKLGLPAVKGLQLSPNPANKYLRINLSIPAAQDAQIRIVNSNGQVVKTLSTRFAAGNNQQIIGLENLSPGMYHAELIIGGRASQSVRFIKE